MARNSIGTLAVQVQADTSQFVSGMAQTQRSLERVTATAVKSRSALAAVGSAARMPGIGRIGALAGGVGGVANAAGLGLVGGGAAGIAAAGTYLLIERIASLERKRAEYNERVAKAAEAAAEAYESQVTALSDLTTRASGIITDTMDPGGTGRRSARDDILAKIRTLDEYTLSLRNARDRELTETGKSLLTTRIEEVAEALAVLRDKFEEVGASGGLGGRLRAGMAGADRINPLARFMDQLTAGAEATRALIASNEAKAEQERQNQLQNKALFEAWRIENQRAFDPIVASIGRIQGQVGQLLFKRDR